MKKIFLLCAIVVSIDSIAQNLGINTTTPQATLDVRGSLRTGGLSNYVKYDSATGKIEWVGASLFTATSQQIIKHSASAEGLYAGGGKLDYRNSSGTPVFYSDWTNGNGYFSGNLGIGIVSPTAKLQIQDGVSGITPFFSARMVVETNNHTYINLLSPDPFETGILFGSGTNAVSGLISYNTTTVPKGFIFNNNGNLTRMVIDNTGRVGIGTTAPNASALLDISSNNKGFLPPRMTITERNAITTPAAGLIVHCTDCTPAGPYSYNGTTWTSMTSSATSTSYTIGQSAQGGIVFWVDESGQHGLVAATADLNGGAGISWWTGIGTNTNAVRNGIYGGAYNTDHINDNQGNGIYAAMVCAQYSGGGYGDWYLPSKEELRLMFEKIYPIGGFVFNQFYWSSTEEMVATGSNANTAWCQTASTGGFGIQDNKIKVTQCKVRVIRRF